MKDGALLTALLIVAPLALVLGIGWLAIGALAALNGRRDEIAEESRR